ncbi:uncharacterized protein LOC111398439 isoform X2 [Olea europaea var. sylvestris]|uniref:uncharacterized protein LOC111398439 isoform X2 n=1 Tax=Olea europaea var. sylvestris TaxID=158386 RepID=UPI000C1CFFE5|nr:uncharacterized protein LOC111398439 isoform X2 [Olea europaea var. sylvestris]
MKEALADLERTQTRILQRISDLELLYLPQHVSQSVSISAAAADNSTTEGRLSSILRSNGVKDFSFKRVPSDYYTWTLEARRDVLDAASIHHLCKSIVLYTARFNAEAVKNFLYALNDGKISKKKFNMRLAPEETSVKLTGYEHNGVTCIGMKTDIPVILDEAIVKLIPDFFWLGGGELDLKLGIKTSEFIDFVNPFIVNCSVS